MPTLASMLAGLPPGTPTTVAAVIVAIAAVCGVGALVLWVRVRKERSRRVEESFPRWTAIAKALGLHAVRRGARVTIEGTLGGLPFEVADDIFLTYGLESQLGMRVKLQALDVQLFVVSGAMPRSLARTRFGLDQLPAIRSLGAAELESAFTLHGNAAGAAILTRAGPDARRILLEQRDFSILWRGTTCVIEFGSGELDAARLSAAQLLMAALVAAAGAPLPT